MSVGAAGVLDYEIPKSSFRQKKKALVIDLKLGLLRK